ncbi:hypothetical protein CTRI78_v000192 [Colletotrichum trifolii]|uniref:Uncharacterized protein n=1 Tax=Colletotrichum trifolii TaxID=5466 RepID=A0A4R8S197_COLTR|nr:hypothetical protein CTRI78_v000192 [Colletotrichum trifolii]
MVQVLLGFRSAPTALSSMPPKPTQFFSPFPPCLFDSQMVQRMPSHPISYDKSSNHLADPGLALREKGVPVLHSRPGLGLAEDRPRSSAFQLEPKTGPGVGRIWTATFSSPASSLEAARSGNASLLARENPPRKGASPPDRPTRVMKPSRLHPH